MGRPKQTARTQERVVKARRRLIRGEMKINKRLFPNLGRGMGKKGTGEK